VINNYGTLQNLDGLSTSQAVFVPADPIINNNGLIVGTVNVAQPAVFNNNATGIWNTAGGSNDFDTTSSGTISDNGIHNRGLIIAADAGALAPVTTTFNNFNLFSNFAGGELRLANDLTGDLAVLNGNFAGSGGLFSIDTVLEDDSSATDRIHITGNTSGSNLLSVNNVGGLGAQTTTGINVIQVDGTSDAGSFALSGPLQAGLYQYTLKQGGDGAADANDWYLVSALTPDDPIFRPAIANYVSAQTANMEVGMMQIDTLHQRMGEQRHTLENGQQMWLRYTYDADRKNGRNRFSYNQQNQGLQLGVDLFKDTDAEGTEKHLGMMLHYAHSRSSSNDEVRGLAGLGSRSGSLHADHFGIGAYYTSIARDGGYIDLVGNVARLNNRFSDIYAGRATQHGWQTTLSAEAGKPIYKNTQYGWQLEPQAQLIYQHTEYQGFRDDFSKIKGYGADNLRGRIGLRLFKDDTSTAQTSKYYFVTNLIHDFMGVEDVNIDGENLKERYDRTRMDIGIGANAKVSENGTIYMDARYHKSLGGDTEGGRLNLGFKLDW
jgi:autotransporter family porin